MDIQSILLPGSSPAQLTQAKLTNWLVGSLLSATVKARPSPDTLLLQINNQHIEAKTKPDIPVRVGEQLNLVVEKEGNPAILKLIPNDIKKTPEEIQQQILRNTLPRQTSMEKLTQALSQTIRNTKETIMLKALPLPVQKEIQKLIEQLPTQSSLKHDTGLKAAIKDSGLFLEAKLLDEVIQNPKYQQTPVTSPEKSPATKDIRQTLAKDLKANLIKLAETITKYNTEIKTSEGHNVSKPTTVAIPLGTNNKPEIQQNTRTEINNRNIDFKANLDIETLSKQVESSISRIEVLQSKAIATQDNPLPILSFEIPVKDKQSLDLLKLDIETDKHAKSENSAEKIWSVNLNINFETIGTISARISMIEQEINATLWSEHSLLNDLINSHLPQLSKQIEKCGLKMGQLQCLEGKPPELNEQSLQHNLINISV